MVRIVREITVPCPLAPLGRGQGEGTKKRSVISRTILSRPPRTNFRAFTLLEVVLAIGLSTVVLLILTTAIHLFLFRTDTGHGEMETNQLARALLNRMADDLRAVRFTPVSHDRTSLGSQETASCGQGSGLVGMADELRVDRAAAWRWGPVPESESDAAVGTPADEIRYARTIDPPETVRYFLREGDEVSAAELARLGSQENPVDCAGLCVERWPTAQDLMGPSQTDSTEASSESVPRSHVEILSPEVIELEFAYADDSGELMERWDSTEQAALPRSVEIRLTLRKDRSPRARDIRGTGPRASLPDGPRPIASGDIIKYRLVVEIPDVRPPRPPTAEPGGKSAGSSRSSNSSGPARSPESSNAPPSTSSGTDGPSSSGSTNRPR